MRTRLRRASECDWLSVLAVSPSRSFLPALWKLALWLTHNAIDPMSCITVLVYNTRYYCCCCHSQQDVLPAALIMVIASTEPNTDTHALFSRRGLDADLKFELHSLLCRVDSTSATVNGNLARGSSSFLKKTVKLTIINGTFKHRKTFRVLL